MIKERLLTIVALLSIAAAAAGPVRGQNASPDVILDFTTNTWDFPAGKSNITYAANSYTSGDYTITLQGGGGSGNGYYFNSNYLLLGKSGAYLQLPAFESAVDSIVVVGKSGGSTSVLQNIYVGETAVSTQTTGTTGTNTYVIDANYRAAGNIYTLKVESGANTQITYIKVYCSTPPTPHTVRMAEGTEEAANWTLASGDASVPGTQVLENVMSGSQVTATYNGTTKKVKSVKAVKYVPPIVNPVVGQFIGSDGKNYDANATLPTGVTAVAKIVYVGSDNGEAAPYNHGLALALSDASNGCYWKTSHTDAGHTKQTSSTFTEESGLQYNATHNSDDYPAFKAAITYSPAAPTGCSDWFLASGYQWKKMIGAAGLSNLGLKGKACYWTSSEKAANYAWYFYTNGGGQWYDGYKDSDGPVRACLAF